MSGANLRSPGRLRRVYKRFNYWSHVVSSMVMPLASPLDGQMRIFDGRLPCGLSGRLPLFQRGVMDRAPLSAYFRR